MSLPNSWLSKILGLFLFVFLTGTLFASSAHAQSYDSSSYNSDVVLTGHTKAQATLIELSAALICQLIGQDVINPERGCLGIDPSTGNIGYITFQNNEYGVSGLLGFSSQMIGALYTPPASSGEYVRYLAHNFGIGPKVQAQTVDTQGFNVLSSLQSIWVTMRNISYIGFTLIFIFIGIAIMLRIKIDPRTVMSIQNQIPKVIVTIILITFSYAIVGFLIDMMWVTTYAGINILTTNTPVDVNQDDSLISEGSSAAEDLISHGVPEATVQQIVDRSTLRETQLREIWSAQGATEEEITNRINKLRSETDENIADLVTRINPQTGRELQPEELTERIDNTLNNNLSVRQVATENLNSTPLSYVSSLFSAAGGFGSFDGLTGLSYDVGVTIGRTISDTVASLLNFDDKTKCGIFHPSGCAEKAFRGAIKWIVGVIGFLIVLAAMFIALMKVWFSLIRALVYIIIYTIIGPLMLVAGLIPGSSMNFSRWIRAILAHLLVFPVTVFVFLLARILASNPQLNNPGQGATFLPPLIANPNSFNNIGLLIAFGLILVAPELLSFVRDAVKAKPGPVGGIVAKGFGAGVGPGTAIPRFTWKKLTQPWDSSKGQNAGVLREMVAGGANAPKWKRFTRRIIGGVDPNKKA